MDKVNDYIFVTNVIPQPVCHEVLKEIKSREWQPHAWYNYSADNFKSEPEKELDTQNTTQALQEKLAPFICQSVEEYMIKFADQKDARINSFIQTFTPIRFNRYRTGTMMRKHYDHIHSIFDGKYKGIPILSLVGILNEDYEGGEFLFSSKHEVTLKAGDILIFPSNFMYPHEVQETTKGERYSFVAWAF
jgi:predicted 2-oxoglutarate/Fe(II)-dependent dioxygenase YbiX